MEKTTEQVRDEWCNEYTKARDTVLQITAFALAKAHACERHQLANYGRVIDDRDAAKWREIVSFIQDLKIPIQSST